MNRWWIVDRTTSRNKEQVELIFYYSPSCIMNKGVIASFPGFERGKERVRSRIKREKDYSSATGGVID